MADKREKELIIQASPCDTNYFDKTLWTIQQSKERGPERCLMYQECKGEPLNCTMRGGHEIAKYVVKGGNLKSELTDFANEFPYFDHPHRNSPDRKTFTIIKGKSNILQAVEKCARIILLEDVVDSVLQKCKKCGGVAQQKTVYDPIHDGPFPLSGSGRTQRRDVEYCPNCDSEPKGKIITVDPVQEIIAEYKPFIKRSRR